MVDIPDELLLGIFLLLDIHDILRCKAVCRYFRRLINDSIAVRYLIELALAGYEDGPYNVGEKYYTISSRLAMLRRHQDAWKNLDWTESHMPVPDERLYELSGGVYATGSDHALTFVQLPSPLRGSDIRTWKHDDLGISIKDFAMDPSRDLLILFEGPSPSGIDDIVPIRPRIHVRTLSTNTPYPLAARPMLQEVAREFLISDTTLQIMGSKLGLLVVNEDEQEGVLLIWDILTGNLILMFEPTHCPLVSFLFLSECSFLVPRVEHSDEDEDDEDDDDFVSGTTINALDVYVYGPDDTPAAPVLKESFLLPTLVRNAIVSNILIFSDPAIGTSPNLDGIDDIDLKSAPHATPKPFHVGLTNRTIVLTWIIYIADIDEDGDEGIAMPTFRTIVISADAFQPISFTTNATIAPPVLHPWADWGPRHTRFLQDNVLGNPLACFAYGTRSVTGVGKEGASTDEVDYFQLCDTNPLAHQSWPLTPSSEIHGEGRNRRIITRTMGRDTPTTTEDIFAEPIITTLPVCHACYIGPFKGIQGIMCDAEHILIFQSEADDAPKILIIYTMG